MELREYDRYMYEEVNYGIWEKRKKTWEQIYEDRI